MSARTARTRDRFSRSLREDLGDPFHIHFKAVVVGTICALGIWLLLHALGRTMGLTHIDDGIVPGAADSAGAWGAVSSLVALLGGAFVASRASGPMNRVAGGLHGIIVWALCALIAAGMALIEAGTAASMADNGEAPSALFGALFGGLVASLAGGALGVSDDQLLCARVAARSPCSDGEEERAVTAVAVTSGSRDAAIDEVWRELAELRRELRQATGHGASKVAR